METKYILIENALEAWAVAIQYGDMIAKGLATLQNKKLFISSLHNAVELFLKQILINQGNHKVVDIRKISTVDDAELCLRYMQATDLNQFFNSLAKEDMDKFRSMEFSQLIEKPQQKYNLNMNVTSFTSAMKILQSLRNNETHFMISSSDYLSDDEFKDLYNFMIVFYSELMQKDLMPYRKGFAFANDERFDFSRTPLQNFSYLDSLKNNPDANVIADYLNNSKKPVVSFNTYVIACECYSSLPVFHGRFDEVWAIICMMETYKTIEYIGDQYNQYIRCHLFVSREKTV